MPKSKITLAGQNQEENFKRVREQERHHLEKRFFCQEDLHTKTHFSSHVQVLIIFVHVNIASDSNLAFISRAAWPYISHIRGYLRTVGTAGVDYIPSYTLVSSPSLQMIFIYWQLLQ